MSSQKITDRIRNYTIRPRDCLVFFGPTKSENNTQSNIVVTSSQFDSIYALIHHAHYNCSNYSFHGSLEKTISYISNDLNILAKTKPSNSDNISSPVSSEFNRMESLTKHGYKDSSSIS